MAPSKNARAASVTPWEGTKTSHRENNAFGLSWWSSRPRTTARGRCLHHAWKTLGKQWLTNQSVVNVFLSSSSMVAMLSDFAKKHAIMCLETFLFVLNLTDGFSSEKTQTVDCCFVSGTYRYTQVSSPVIMSQTRGDLRSSNFLNMWVNESTLTSFCFSPRWWGTQWAQHFIEQSWRMRVRPPDEIFTITCISARHFWGSLSGTLPLGRRLMWRSLPFDHNGHCLPSL